MENQLIKYQSLPIWNKDTLPKSFREKHNTKKGTWAKLTILKGELKYYVLDPDGKIQTTHIFSKQNPAPYIEPQVWHKVEPVTNDLECFLEFYCRPEQYYQKKYKLSAPHSEVIEALKYIQTGDALDLGCGRGRNSIFLQKNGFDVTSLDRLEASINKLREIINTEECKSIHTDLYDIQTASIKKDYDLIIATVVFQFLRQDCISAVIKNMQDHTRPGGYNLIVAPASTEDHPCPIKFSFTFEENELKNYYRNWNIHKYNENMGTFQRKDENGNFYQTKFATLIAQKKD